MPDHFPDDSGIKFYDIERFIREYPLRMSPIGIDENGSLDFKYLRFVFPLEREWDEDIRYFTMLRDFRASEPAHDVGHGQLRSLAMNFDVREDLVHSYRIRKLGKYVLSRPKKEERPHGYGYASLLLSRPRLRVVDLKRLRGFDVTAVERKS